MTSKELEVKLRAEINDDIRIYEHKSLAGISNVFWREHEVCPCPTFDVRDEYNPNYTYEFPTYPPLYLHSITPDTSSLFPTPYSENTLLVT